MASNFPFEGNWPRPGQMPGPARWQQRRARRRAPSQQPQQPMGTVTFLFSDVVGSMPQFERQGDRRARAFFRPHDELIRAQAARFEGHLYRREGDGFFISFRSTREALRCAIAIQRGLVDAYRVRNGDTERPHVRIGLHVGETIEEEGDYYGTAVNLAARVRNEAGPDQILVTELVRGLAHGEPEFRYRFFKDATLKGIDGTVRLYELLWRQEDVDIDAAADQAVAPKPGPAKAVAAAAPVPAAPADDAIRAYAAALAEWCTTSDLSEWQGRYVALTARVQEGRGVLAPRQAARRLDLQDCFDHFPQLVVAGDAGSGKTTALLEAAVRAARRLESEPDAPVPVFVPLINWRPGQDLLDLLVERLAAHGLVWTLQMLTERLAAGRLLLLLDGIDELGEPTTDAPARLAELEALPRRFPLCRLALTTRQALPGDAFGSLPLAVVQPLRPNDLRQYLARYVGDAERGDAMFAELGGRDRSAWLRPDSLISLARNPLTLNVVIEQELVEGSTAPPSRAGVLQAYARHLHRLDVRRGSRLPVEVKEALLAGVAHAWKRERRTGPVDRADLAQVLREVLAELRADELTPAWLDVSTVLAELDRRFLSPLLPRPPAGGQYDWSHPLFQDYLAAVELRRRCSAGRWRELDELIGGDARHRWTGAVLFLSELLDDAGLLELLDACMRGNNPALACRALDHALAAGVRRRSSTTLVARHLARLLAGHADHAEHEGGEQHVTKLLGPFQVVCEALIEPPPAGSSAHPAEHSTDDGEAAFSATVGTALLAAAHGVAPGALLTALTLGMDDQCLRSVQWALGPFAGEVAAVRARLERLSELPPVAGPPEQHRLRQGLALAIAGTTDAIVSLELCRRVQALVTSDRLPAAQARLLARDTLGVHVPLARRLSLWALLKLLEGGCLQVLEPERFVEVAAIGEDLRLRRREKRLDWLGDVLTERLDRHGVAADVETDAPHVAAIATELRRLAELGLPRAALHGLGRVVVNVPDEVAAERAVAALEELWPGTVDAGPEAVPLTPAIPRPGRRELVAYPSEGGLVRVLVQTVPPDELEVTGRGDGDGCAPLRARMERLLRELLEDAGDKEKVFAVTKSGQVIGLPAGATPVDFAYHIHTRLGHRCSGALVNGKPEPLTYKLRHGDRVEVLTDPGRELPPVEWLCRPDLLRTGRAQRAVQQALESAWRADAVRFGRGVVEHELVHAGTSDGLLLRLLRALGFQRAETLYEAVGAGEVARREVAYTLGVLQEAEAGGRDEPSPSADRSHDALHWHEGWTPAGADVALRPRYARCCRPQPGDPIVGYVADDSDDVVVHHRACPTGAASGRGRSSVAMHWRPPRRDGVTLVRIQTRRSRTVAPQVRRLAEQAGVEVVDLASGRATEGPQTLTLECRCTEVQVAELVRLVDRLPDTLSVAAPVLVPH